jgi:hypothetical protein
MNNKEIKMSSDEIKNTPEETSDTDELLKPSLDHINNTVKQTDELTTAELDDDIVGENTHDGEQQASQQHRVGLLDKLKNNVKTVVLAVVAAISTAAVPI